MKVKKAFPLFFCIISVAVLLFLVLLQPINAQQGEPLWKLDEKQDGYYIMKSTEDDSVIIKTARLVSVGDTYIDQNNRLFLVVQVEGDTAWARHLRNIDLSPPFHKTLADDINIIQAQAEDENNVIAIYHTHGAEAYVPSDGSESILEGGGILDVGESFEDALEEKPFKPIRSDETHVPHDANAYQRSRRTAEEILKHNPIALFDVHRDAVPAEEYIEEVDGEETVQILFVVGRQNQNSQANQSFAEGLKKISDDLYPGLIKGILIANGSYNQDLHPSSLLLEVGTHETAKEGAQETTVLFADVVDAFFHGADAVGEGEGVGSVALRSALWVVLVALVAVGAFMLLSTGSKEELISKIKHFFQKEFAELNNKGNKGDDDDKS